MAATLIYANTIASYNEGKLLSRDKINRLMDANFSDAVKILCDFGYGGGEVSENSYDIDKFISIETTNLIDYALSDCPNIYLARLLTNKFYYTNAKTLYKNKYTQIDLVGALYGIDCEELKNGIESGDYANIAQSLADTLKLLDKLFEERAVSPQLIDLYINRAMCADNIMCAKKSHSRIMIKYVASEIDLNNIITILRCKRLAFDEAKSTEMLLEGGKIAINDILAILQLDNAKIASFFITSPYADIMSKFCASDDIVTLESDVDNYLYNLVSIDKNNMVSLSPFLSYFVAKLMEFKIVKTILVCLKNNSKDSIAQRLRNFLD